MIPTHLGTRPLLVAVTALSLSAAQAQDAPAPPPRPKYSLLPQDEDWSVLRGRESSDLFDPLKFVPLNADDSIWVSFGGSARARVERFDEFRFDTPAAADDDDVYLLTRATAHADLHLGEMVRVFGEVRAASVPTGRELAGGRRTVDVDSFDLQQGFVDVRPLENSEDFDLTLRGGRQMFAFGKQRLVSPLPWANTGRTWDGLTAIVRTGGFTITGFYTVFDPVQKYEFNDGDRDLPFYGVYAAGKLPGSEVGLDVYALGRERPSASVNGTTGDEERYTLGARLSSKRGAVDGELEAAYQLGEIGDEDIRAFMLAAQVGYVIEDLESRPRVFLGYDYASGDRHAGGTSHTFDPLFPLGHAYFGIIDAVNRQNVQDLSAGVSGKLPAEVQGTLAVHRFTLATSGDALYDAGGAVLLPGGSGAGRSIGTELDVVLTRAFGPHVSTEIGYGHLFRGDAIDDTLTGSDIDFGYGSVSFRF